MFKRVNVSPATRSVSAACSASEKKEKKKKLYFAIGCAVSALFISTALYQTAHAFSNANNANIAYSNRIAQALSEREKAKSALEKELSVSISNDGVITKDITSDSNPVETNDSNRYYTTSDGDIVCVDGNDVASIYHMCTACSNCGHVTDFGSKCEQCGSDLYNYVIYQVQSGDTLSEISGAVGASVDSIAHLNEIDNVNLIYTGESLRIPE